MRLAPRLCCGEDCHTTWLQSRLPSFLCAHDWLSAVLQVTVLQVTTSNVFAVVPLHSTMQVQSPSTCAPAHARHQLWLPNTLPSSVVQHWYCSISAPQQTCITFQPWFLLSTASIEHQQPPINCIQHDTMTCSGLTQQHLPGVAQRNAQMWREHLATNPYKPPNTQRLTASDNMAATQAHAYTCSSCDPGTLTVGCPCLPGSQPTSQTKAQVQATPSRPLWPVNNLTNDTMNEQQLSATHQKGNCRTPGTMPWA
jgi:hypothetical protein